MNEKAIEIFLNLPKTAWMVDDDDDDDDGDDSDELLLRNG